MGRLDSSLPDPRRRPASALAGLAPPSALPDPRAIALVNRLLTVEERVLRLETENAALRRAGPSAEAGAAEPAWFDIKRTRHEWKLAEDEQAAPGDLWLYDVRTDDDVVLAGREGRAFFDRFGLLGGEPDFAGAVAAINGIAPAGAADPVVSIVIPVYGQLAYTLNCLHSLARHKSRFAKEVIVIDDASPDASATFLPRLTGFTYHAQPANAGFIASCNLGAALARGQFIVMLNNDTRVVDGWLDELIGSFAIWPEAGLVGSKLHYADGSLQEAGGIVWRDGSAWNYGRNDDPNRPDYSYARQVDYISGCSIAVPAALWRELGGFDPLFSPAYCEDVDLAFRIRAGGRQVWFQPRSRIVHYEGKTSGTDTGSGVKAYQVSNTKKLFLRWREALAGHRRSAEAPYFERERGAKKRFLVVDVTAPTPDQDAGSVQTFLALQVCLALGYKTHFVPEDNWLFQPNYTTALQRIGVDCAYAPYEVGFEAYIRRYGWMFDAVMVYRPSVMEKCLPLLRAYAPQAAVMFHVADLHYLRMERTAALNDDEDMRQAAALMKDRELALVNEVDCTITHSIVEQEILATIAPGAPVALWPLMSEFHGTEKTYAERRDICFLGGYRHPPNVDAVIWFITEVLPLIRAEEPEIRFIVAGAHAPEEIAALASEHVIVTGMVPDLRDLFDPCRVFVCPLRVGAGVKGKVAAALSYGIPIVSTPIGIEGTEMVHEHNVLVAEDARAFAAATLRLYRDHWLWGWLSRNGQELVRETLSLEMGARVLNQAVETALAHKLGLSA
jgi:GT2 family glycosyltransferase